MNFVRGARREKEKTADFEEQGAKRKKPQTPGD
jgi:hypothetical protein